VALSDLRDGVPAFLGAQDAHGKTPRGSKAERPEVSASCIECALVPLKRSEDGRARLVSARPTTPSKKEGNVQARPKRQKPP
jgi:hypothetical protein